MFSCSFYYIPKFSQWKIHDYILWLELISDQAIEQFTTFFTEYFFFLQTFLKLPGALTASLCQCKQRKAFLNLRFNEVTFLWPAFCAKHKNTEIHQAHEVHFVCCLCQYVIDFLAKNFSSFQVLLKVSGIWVFYNLSDRIALTLQNSWNLRLWKKVRVFCYL